MGYEKTFRAVAAALPLIGAPMDARAQTSPDSRGTKARQNSGGSIETIAGTIDKLPVGQSHSM